MSASLDVLHLRRPKIDYVSPPVCENVFTGSGSPVIVLEPFDALGKVTGIVIGGGGSRTLSWENYPGAICYTIYRSTDGVLELLFECVENPFTLPPDFEGDIVITPITPDGEGEPSDRIHIDGPAPVCEEFIDSTIVPLVSIYSFGKGDGMIAGSISGIPSVYFDRVEAAIRTSRPSGAIQASQSGNDLVNSVGDFFVGSDVGKFLKFSSGGIARKIIAVTGPTQVQVDMTDTVVLSSFTIYGATVGGSSGDVYLASGGGHAAGIEETPSGSTRAVWYDHTTVTLRDIGDSNVFLPQRLNATGHLLVSNSGGLGFQIYNPNTQLFTSSGDTTLTGVDMNDSLVVVGSRQIPNPPFGTLHHAFKWQAGVVSHIEPADTDPSGGFPVARRVSNSGLVLGDYPQDVGGGSFRNRVFYNNGLLSASIGFLYDGVDSTEGGMSLNDLSNSGIAVGNGDIDGTNTRPWRWSLADGLQQLSILAGHSSGNAQSVNDAGYIVGVSDSTAVIWFPGETTARRLLDFVPPDQGWTSMTNALAISNDDEIFGVGVQNGVAKQFFMKLCFG